MFLVLALLIAAILFPPLTADPVSELSVQTSANVLQAGSNNTIVMSIQGIGKLLSNLDVSLTLPPPLVLFGDNHWRRSSFGPGDSIMVTLMIFAPASAAGNSYQATVSGLYKEAGETTYSEESHTIGFLVRGWIDIVIYDMSVTPSPTGPGSTVTISGSLLNRGIIAAMFTNITIKPAPPLIVTSQSVSYLGQLDPNAPAPFSLSANIEPTTHDGRYDATLIVYYQDDLHINKQADIHVVIDISSAATITQTGVREGPLSSLLENTQFLLGLVILIVLALILALIRRGRARLPSK